MHFSILTTQYGDIASFTFFQANLYELRHTRTHSRTKHDDGDDDDDDWPKCIGYCTALDYFVAALWNSVLIAN